MATSSSRFTPVKLKKILRKSSASISGKVKKIEAQTRQHFSYKINVHHCKASVQLYRRLKVVAKNVALRMVLKRNDTRYVLSAIKAQAIGLKTHCSITRNLCHL